MPKAVSRLNRPWLAVVTSIFLLTLIFGLSKPGAVFATGGAMNNAGWGAFRGGADSLAFLFSPRVGGGGRIPAKAGGQITNGVVFAGDVPQLIAALRDVNVDTIYLNPGGTYTLTAPDNGVDGWNGLPDINHGVTIYGRNATIRRDPAAPPFRFFHVSGAGNPGIPVNPSNAGALFLNDLTLTGGLARGGKGGDSQLPGGGGAGMGGAIFNNGGVVVLTHCKLIGNRAEGGAAGAGVDPYGYGGGGGLGGNGGPGNRVLSAAGFHVTSGGGGGSGGSAGNGNLGSGGGGGGGLFACGGSGQTLACRPLADCFAWGGGGGGGTLSACGSNGDGFGIGSPFGGGRGGAIDPNCFYADGGGGGGGGNQSIPGGSSNRSQGGNGGYGGGGGGGSGENTGACHFGTGLGGRGGFGGGGGGGFIQGGLAGWGGGGGGSASYSLAGFGGGSGNVQSSNGFGGYGGGDIRGGGAGMGGAIFTYGGYVVIGYSTLSGNVAQGGNTTIDRGGPGGGFGGAVFVYSGQLGGNANDPDLPTGASVTVDFLQSTISGNSALRGTGGTGPTVGINAGGGGIFAYSRSSAPNNISVTACTVTDNTCSPSGRTSIPSAGGIMLEMDGGNGPRCTLRNSIIAGTTQTKPDLARASSSSPFISAGYNLVGYAFVGLSNGANNDQISTDPGAPIDPRLGPLADNGGPEFTHALTVGSPAHNRGDSGLATTYSVDQRGAARFCGTAVDIGSYEEQRSFFTLQPVSQTICLGAPVTFRVTVTDSPSLQWRKNGVNIPGATSATYTINTVTAADAGTYDCFSGLCFGNFSDSATLTVTQAPVITGQPVNRDVCAGTSTSFSVTATGTPAPTFQWRRNGVNIAGANAATLNLSNLTTANSGTYDCVVGNTCTSVISSPATLLVRTGPVITTQPQDQTVCASTARVRFTVAAPTATAFQWRLNGQNVINATSDFIEFSADPVWNGSRIDCLVTDGCGTTTSNTVTFVVDTPPTVTAQPVSRTACVGGSVSFTLGATGATTFQWKKNGTPIAGATAATFTIPSVAAGDAGDYVCAFGKGACLADSNPATLTVTPALVLTGQPTSRTVCAGASASFTVTATGPAPITYQWRKNGTDIAGATAATYSIAATVAGDAGAYTCVVGSPCGPTTSQTANLTVNASPAITAQPTDRAACIGQPVSFSVTATGTPTPTFQWRKNGTNISGATSAIYSISSVAAGDAATYDCVLVNSCATVTSGTATLTVNTPVSISNQPVNQTACLGTAASFTIAATGSPAPTFQWQKNGSNIPGATGATLSFAAVAAGDGANYDCQVTNACGTVVSSVVSLTVQTPAVITTQPAGRSVCVGASTTFTVAATGSPAPTFQWRKNGAPIGGATGASFIIPSVNVGDAGNYDCVISNACATVISNVAALAVPTAPPTLTGQPVSRAVCEGSPATLTVTATGATGYQWRKNGTPISGATSASFTIPAVELTDGGTYDCVVSSQCASTTSDPATLTINPKPVISAQTGNRTVCAGAPVTFTVTATGATSYQWRRNGAPIGGATGSSFTIAATALTDAGTFDCVLTSTSGCAINTTPATLVVQTLNIVQQPADKAVCLNAPLSLCLALDTASQTPDVSYQWRRNGVNVANRNGNSACWSPVSNQAQSGDAGVYDCVISTTGCSTVSGTARVTVIDARPTYSLQPLGGVICAGESKTFTAAAGPYIGEADYKWYKVGVSGPIGSGSTLTVANAKESDSGVYYCQVRNACHSLDSNAVTLTVRGAVAVTGQPTPATACVGGRANFSVVATGTTDFQWQADSGNGFVNLQNAGGYSGVNTATLTVEGIPASFNGNAYRCLLTASCNSTASLPAVLTVTAAQAPVISAQTGSFGVCAGSPATFSVTATGATAYQWRKDGTPISGATGATFTIASVAAANGGSYDCLLTGAGGCGTVSRPAVLTVDQPLEITQDLPESIGECLDTSQSVFIGLGLNGETPTTIYRWRRNGVDFNNPYGNASFLGIYPDELNNGVYDCVVSNGCSTVFSKATRVTFTSAEPTFTVQPVSQTVCAGSAVTLRAEAPGTLDYVWINEATNLAVSVGPVLTFPSVTAADAGTYHCLSVNYCYAVASNSVTLTVGTGGAATLTTQPADATACEGGTATFTVAASGAVAGYRWQADSGNGFVDVNDGGGYAGATGPTLTVTGVSGALNGTRYRCVLNAGCGALQSKEARLTVPGVAIAADSAVCFGVTGLRATGPAGATAYRWSISNGFITSSNNQWEMVYTPSSAGTVTLTLEVMFPGGCVRTITKTVAVNDCRPAVTAAPATGVGARTATLAGTVNPNGSETNAAFLYGTTPGGPYPFAAQAGPVPMDGTTTRPVSAALTGLTTGVTYYFVVEAVNQYGRSRSTERSFRTALCGVTLSASGASFPASGGTGRLAVTAAGDCGWTVTGVPDWIQNLTPTGATGSGNVTFTVAPNRTETGRSATLDINGQTFTVTQSPSVAVNGSIAFRVVSTTIAPSSCGGSYANDYVMTATLTNTGTQAIFNPYVQVMELAEAAGSPPPPVPFRLLTVDGASCTQGGLPGDRQTTDGALSPVVLPTLAPGQSVTMRFAIAMPSLRRFRFLFNVLGSLETPTINMKSKVSGTALKATETGGKPFGFELTVEENGRRPRAVPISETPEKISLNRPGFLEFMFRPLV
jgi:hypothetical protein